MTLETVWRDTPAAAATLASVGLVRVALVICYPFRCVERSNCGAERVVGSFNRAWYELRPRDEGLSRGRRRSRIRGRRLIVTHPQEPPLHELVSCVQAPTAVLSGPDGQIRPGGGQGVLRRDRRVLSELVVEVEGQPPVAVGHRLLDAGSARFVGVVRGLGEPGADPTVRLERERRAGADRVDERLALVNPTRTEISATVTVRAAADLASVTEVKRGGPVRPRPATAAGGGWEWADDHTGVRLRATGDPTVHGSSLRWRVRVPARGRWEVALALTVTDRSEPAPGFRPAPAASLGWRPVTGPGPADLTRLLHRGVGDLVALALAEPAAPADAFIAGGSPWFFTLFGRDSLWAARLTLPLGSDLARGTLRTLARRQGRRHDPVTAEAPGKILHEVRSPLPTGGPAGLPPVYFGTVDATALWVCLLHDAWRWGMAEPDVADLLDPLAAALDWLLGDADSDGDGFLEYLDLTGHGLANQGWKDSGDSIQFPDGSIAEPPIALSEAQAYAYQAAVGGAALLDALGRPGAGRVRDWAAQLRHRFREAFWVSDARGSFPAIALDGAKKPVPTATSNLGHLLGTGLLDPAEAAAVAARLGEPDLDSGYGLRTMSADALGFNPLGYHAGTVWPHDTAIAVQGLVAEGHPAVAASLAAGLLRAAPEFDYRLPELFGGTDARAGEPVLAYPAACRPQAWSAAVPVALLQAALGLAADVPAGVLRVRPAAEFADWFPLRVGGLQVAGHPVTVTVDATGRARVETAGGPAPVVVTGP
ncbi:MAG: amylo-alpha-1,6-glucosidase [Micromonosporaceae bacterium]|nr:amylo-alpha-1,6-glucosidase [Micromonosporaceae bacterium]